MALPNPNNGQVMTPLGTTFTNVATYSCNPGYALSGSATQTCDANGLWTPEAPTCIGKTVLSITIVTVWGIDYE